VPGPSRWRGSRRWRRVGSRSRAGQRWRWQRGFRGHWTVASSPKGSAAQVGRGEGGDGAVLGGLDTADGQAGGDEGGGEQRGDDRQQHRGPDAERGDQAERERRSHRGCPSLVRSRRPGRRCCRDEVGEQGVAGRDAQTAGGPGASPQHPDLPDAAGGAGQRGQGGGEGVAADRDAAPVGRVVGECSVAELRRVGQGVGDPSIRPGGAAGAPRVLVSRLGSSAVGISWPTSARKLAAPIPAHDRSAVSAAFPSDAQEVESGVEVGDAGLLLREGHLQRVGQHLADLPADRVGVGPAAVSAGC